MVNVFPNVKANEKKKKKAIYSRSSIKFLGRMGIRYQRLKYPSKSQKIKSMF